MPFETELQLEIHTLQVVDGPIHRAHRNGTDLDFTDDLVTLQSRD